MKGKPKKDQREKDLTGRFLRGDFDEDRVEQEERFSDRSKHQVQRKVERTAALRASEGAGGEDLGSLPVGEVVQVYSLFCEAEEGGKKYLCVSRKTMARLSETSMVVGDRVRFRATGVIDPEGRPEAVIEEVLERETILCRADSFKARRISPIVANAQQMLIVASLLFPRPKWGLVDRMLVAAESGGLEPIVCLNKVDLANTGEGVAAMREAEEVLGHYASLGVRVLRTSADGAAGLEALCGALRDRTTVLAGHSGVGKSSLIRAIQPQLDIRVGEVSELTQKGMHTTTSARRYPLDFGGAVIDTPGVKLFGLWNVGREGLSEFFPDVEEGSAPAWRVASYERILASLPEEGRGG